MALSRRREIINFIKDQLSLINGQISTFDPSFTYTNNIFGNVYRRIMFIDEINDHPTISLQAGSENRIYHSSGLVEASLDLVLRVYVNSDTPAEDLESLVADIEHVIYSLDRDPDMGIMDIIIENISTDEGLLAPNGLGEVFVTVFYKLKT